MLLALITVMLMLVVVILRVRTNAFATPGLVETGEIAQVSFGLLFCTFSSINISRYIKISMSAPLSYLTTVMETQLA